MFWLSFILPSVLFFAGVWDVVVSCPYPPFPDSLATVSCFWISFTLLVISVLNIWFIIVLFIYVDLFLRRFSKICMSFSFVLLYLAVIKVSGLNISVRLAVVLYFMLCISWYTFEMIKNVLTLIWTSILKRFESCINIWNSKQDGRKTAITFVHA